VLGQRGLAIGVGTGVTGGCRDPASNLGLPCVLVFKTFTREGMGFGATGAGAVSPGARLERGLRLHGGVPAIYFRIGRLV